MQKSNNKLIIGLVICIAVLLCIFVLLVFYFGNSNSNGEDVFDTSEHVLTDEELALIAASDAQAKIDAALSKLVLTKDFRSSLRHGSKPAAYQKYIVLHDTEGDGRAENVVSG